MDEANSRFRNFAYVAKSQPINRILLQLKRRLYIYIYIYCNILGYDTAQAGMCVPIYQITRCLNPKRLNINLQSHENSTL